MQKSTKNAIDAFVELNGGVVKAFNFGTNNGVELLAEQMIKKFPLPIETQEFRDQWFTWLKQYGLEPSCYDAFLEMKLFDNRMNTTKEKIKK